MKKSFLTAALSRPALTDEAVVERARRALSVRAQGRWMLFLNAALFLGLCGYFTVASVRKIEDLSAEKLSGGFLYGLALAVGWCSFGLIGALFLGKGLVGLSRDFRDQELLVRYHDRLRELGALPAGQPGETAASRSNPADAPGNTAGPPSVS